MFNYSIAWLYKRKKKKNIYAKRAKYRFVNIRKVIINNKMQTMLLDHPQITQKKNNKIMYKK